MVAQFFKAIRPINLAIVGGYQYIIYYKYILSIVENPRLSPLHFLGFVVTTLLVTAGGYLINDYYDHEGDLINKTNWHKLNKSTLWNAYIVVTLLGFIIALWIAYQIRHLSYAGIYAFAVALLYVYSAWAKRQALIGNIIVAAFSGLSILVLLLTEWPALTIVMTISPTGYETAVTIIGGMAIFAFFVSLIRELVKDVEDIKGDQSSGYRTLPITIGVPRTKFLIIFYLLLTIFLTGLWSLSQWHITTLASSILFLLGVMGSLVVSTYLAFRLEGKSDYTRLSTLLKITMVIAMIYTCIV